MTTKKSIGSKVAKAKSAAKRATASEPTRRPKAATRLQPAKSAASVPKPAPARQPAASAKAKVAAKRSAAVKGEQATKPQAAAPAPKAIPARAGAAVRTGSVPHGQSTSQAAPKAAAVPAAAPKLPAEPKKPVSQRHGFKTNEYIVYPAHGVGKIVGIEEQEVAGLKLELFVIAFEKDKMTLRVPTAKTQSVGMRKLSEEPTLTRAMETLKGRARIKRTMWSRRAQEYEAKINSGDLISIAEVVRDLYRSENQPEQSYSERQLYEQALDRMAREIAAVEKLDDRGAVQKITEVLARANRGLRIERASEPSAESQAA
jgi:CarD family transcriptional regulator